ncbi:Leucine-rich repeat and IQ domain-containing 1 [Paramuricea clavata]|nr:Leucine-rich repeat and IQ domain-containing 1 [Paramuricea clavata]
MKREERHKRRQEELDALERKEKRLMEEAVQKAKEEEMRRLKEIENEKKRKEEEEKKRLEDERRRVEEEEIRRKLEKEQEEERKMKLEMQRRRQEEERLERERLEKEEQERKMAEERKRREEEERRRIEEQRKLEEGKRLEEQRKLQQKKLQEQRELEQRRLEEQKKLEELERMKIQVEERKQNGMKEITKQNEDCLEAKEGQGKEKKISKTLVEEDKSSEQAQMLQKKDVVGQEETNYSDLLRKSDNSESLNRAKESRTSDNVLISKEHKVNNTISTAKEKSIDVCDDSILEWESCRDEWLKRTVLWSTLSMDEKANVKSRSKPRRPLSASQKLPSVSEEELLKSQNKMISLDKIVCINVKGLPPRNLKIMSKCPNVKSVTVQNCSVLSAESFDNCNHLLELNLSDNSIQNISCQNLQSLESLDLRNNQLTSIHGLDGCHKLRSLYLDGNKITRTGTFPSNKVIHLSLQNNQLITTKGLSTWKYLQILDCSNNHLSQIQELDSCPLLRILKLRGNNLRKPPDLSNHVLLRELHLSENSISSLEGLSDQWLPLLQHLYVNNNSLSSVCPLRNFPMLETLDVKNNLVSDEENLLPGLTECHQLRSLSIHGNPVCEDSNVRFGIVKTLPKLKFLDGEKLESGMNKDNSTGKTIFYPICGAQIIAQDDLLERQKSEIENCQAESNDDNLVVRRLKLQSRHFQELQDLMIKHRLEHENVKKPEMNLGSQRDRASISSSLTQQNKESESEAVKSVSRAKDTSIHTRSPGVSVANLNKTAGNDLWKPKHHQAATLIQAKFRGYRMRRRYLEATQTAQYSNIDLETEDFNFDEEVDLNMFDMDEAALDSSWLPTNLPQTARNAIVHDESPSKQEQVNKQQVGSYNPPTEIEEDGKLPPSHEDSDRPFPRKHAWRSPDSPISSPNPRNVIPPIKAPSVLSEETSPPIETHRSHRTSELSSEWGFSKNSTAELMLKRANRMKYNALRKKEMTNPEKRFQLFKKADESNKARGVQAIQKRKEKPRVDYFSGRPDGDHQTTKKEEQESQAKQEMTFSWVYDQAVLHKDQGEEILKDTRQYYCESKSNKNRPDRSSPGVSLPRMDPVILAGRNLPLVASPVSNPRTPSIYSGDVEIGSRRKYSWQQTKTHSNPDLTRVGLGKESRSGKSNSAEARIIKERNHIL